MISRLFRRNRRDDIIASLYGAIVAQARLPAFYRCYGVPDTVNGRFEMIVLHLALLLGRFDTEPAPVRGLGQQVFDLFCRDMDANMREMGVGDISVPRRMRVVGEAFYGRKRAYEAALAEHDPAFLAAALARNVFAAPDGETPAVAALAEYTRTAARQLKEHDVELMRQGHLGFPQPPDIAVPSDTAAGAQ
jgi:cytochrome b pre-mRNA-processing protein 3